MRRIDVVIIGAGTAGLGAFREVMKQTERFVLVNDGPWGTMCARVGCMPSKALIEAANAYHRRRDFETFGIHGGEGVRVDVPAVLAHVRRVRDELVKSTVEMTANLGDRAISGRARITGPNRVEVNGEELHAGHIIIATGSRPTVPDKWKPLSDRFFTTDAIFEQRDLPKRIAVLGLGPLGAELAQALARLGCEVTAFESKAMCAGLSDESVNAALIEALRAELTVHNGHEVELSAQGDGLSVEAGGASVVVDRALVALGRAPNIDGLGLEELGVKRDEHGRIEVDPCTLQIGDLPIFLAGDAKGGRLVQHEAADEGHISGLNATSGAIKKYRRRVPLGIVFTEPNVATIGKRHGELDADGIVVGDASFADQGRATLALRPGGRLRVYADKKTGQLLGSELCAPDGEHLAHLIALAIDRGATVRELLRTPFYHPCLEEGLRTALRQAAEALPGDAAFELEST